jgi:hypothetical protein
MFSMYLNAPWTLACEEEEEEEGEGRADTSMTGVRGLGKKL